MFSFTFLKEFHLFTVFCEMIMRASVYWFKRELFLFGEILAIMVFAFSSQVVSFFKAAH